MTEVDTDTIPFATLPITTINYLNDIGADKDNLTNIQQRAVSYLDAHKVEESSISVKINYEVKDIISYFKRLDNFEVKFLTNVRNLYSDVRVDCPLNEELAIECFRESITQMDSVERGISQAQMKYLATKYYKSQLDCLAGLKARDMKKLYADKPEWVKQNEMLQKELTTLKDNYNKLASGIKQIEIEMFALRADVMPSSTPKWIMRVNEAISKRIGELTTLIRFHEK